MKGNKANMGNAVDVDMRNILRGPRRLWKGGKRRAWKSPVERPTRERRIPSVWGVNARPEFGVGSESP